MDYGDMTSRYSPLLSKKGYYVFGFTTTLEKATSKDLELAETYGVQLVSKFEKLEPVLMYLHEKESEHKSSLSTQTYAYLVKIGVMIIGELKISIQILPKDYYRITYIYNYRTDIGNYRRQNNIKIKRNKKHRWRNNNKYKKYRK